MLVCFVFPKSGPHIANEPRGASGYVLNPSENSIEEHMYTCQLYGQAMSVGRHKLYIEIICHVYSLSEVLEPRFQTHYIVLRLAMLT